MGKLADISLLYVEDEEGIRNSVARSLSILTKKVSVVENGLEALDYLKEHSVDLIVTDIRMPKMDGLSFIDRLRHENIDIPVIITSAFNEPEYLTKAIELKVDKFINKPIRMNDLLEVVSRLAEVIANKRLLAIRQQELEYYREAVDKATFQIRIRPDGTILETNKDLASFFNLHGVLKKEYGHIEELFKRKDVEEIFAVVLDYKVYNKTVSFLLNGAPFTVVVTAFASLLEDHAIKEISILLNDITPVLREKEKIIHELHYDRLTELPNRIKLFEDLENDEHNKEILIVDIENFARSNQLYGFESGDEILIQMARLLESYWPDERPHAVYRNDADRFIILTEKMETFDRNRAEQVAHQLIYKIEHHPFTLGNVLNIDIDVTVGASCIDGNDPLSEALLALDVAKKDKKPFVCFSDLVDIRENISANLQMQRKVKQALNQELFINYYQPIVDVNGDLLKYEALVRMIDPDDHERVLSPFHFLDIARQSKNYPKITRRVIENAFGSFGDGSAAFSINLSFDDISNPDTVLYLEHMLKTHPDAHVTLELLESEGLKDLDETIRFFHWMKGYGSEIAIDDFGSGYSNFAYFFDMPLDILKIDGSVVRRIHEYRGYVALESIVRFAESLGIKTVAEFVEDEATFRKLKTLGVSMYQGYYFSAPKPFEEL